MERSSRARVDLPIGTERLRVHEWRQDEADTVLGLLGPAQTMGEGRARVRSLAEAQMWLDKRLAQQREHGLTMWAVERLTDSSFVGACGLFPQDERLELGYTIER